MSIVGLVMTLQVSVYYSLRKKKSDRNKKTTLYTVSDQ